jgi:hypothetical protein
MKTLASIHYPGCKSYLGCGMRGFYEQVRPPLPIFTRLVG